MFTITMTTNNKTFTFSMMSTSTRIIIMFVFPPVVMILAFTRMTTMFPTVIIPTHFYTSSQTRVILFYVLIEKMLV
ncbi:hypothetical protein CN412_21765 [Bacillus cereus]|nr:hypothetical protein CN412_21765 [Bacillus cereus]